MDQPRAERIARNEASARATNETLESGLSALPLERDELVAFVCECGNAACRELVKVDLTTYERIRNDARHFLLVPGHEIPATEDVVERGDHHIVVQKHDRTRPVVESTDPRGPG